MQQGTCLFFHFARQHALLLNATTTVRVCELEQIWKFAMKGCNVELFLSSQEKNVQRGKKLWTKDCRENISKERVSIDKFLRFQTKEQTEKLLLKFVLSWSFSKKPHRANTRIRFLIEQWLVLKIKEAESFIYVEQWQWA